MANEKVGKFRRENAELIAELERLRGQFIKLRGSSEPGRLDSEEIYKLDMIQREMSARILELNAAMQEQVTPMRELA